MARHLFSYAVAKKINEGYLWVNPPDLILASICYLIPALRSALILKFMSDVNKCFLWVRNVYCLTKCNVFNV